MIGFCVIWCLCQRIFFFFFFLNDPPPPDIYPLPLHAALPTSRRWPWPRPPWRRCGGPVPGPEYHPACSRRAAWAAAGWRSEEHTSELQSRLHLVCRLLLEKKKNEE